MQSTKKGLRIEVSLHEGLYLCVVVELLGSSLGADHKLWTVNGVFLSEQAVLAKNEAFGKTEYRHVLVLTEALEPMMEDTDLLHHVEEQIDLPEVLFLLFSGDFLLITAMEIFFDTHQNHVETELSDTVSEEFLLVTLALMLFSMLLIWGVISICLTVRRTV